VAAEFDEASDSSMAVHPGWVLKTMPSFSSRTRVLFFFFLVIRMAKVMAKLALILSFCWVKSRKILIFS
jgi:hypothetical protein